MELINIEVIKKNFKIRADIIFQGNDIIILVKGGKAHIGAVGVSIPTDSIITGEQTAYTSIITLPSHKEDAVVKLIGENVSKKIGKNVVVIAGIHFDNISQQEIKLILNACEELSGKIVEKLG